jgi:CRISPR-associated protein Cmr5
MSPGIAPKLSLDQQRAAFAYSAVAAIRDAQPQGPGSDYTGVVQNLPVAILQNGVGQTVAFLMSKAGKDAGARVAMDHLATWLIDERRMLSSPNPPADLDRLMQALLGSSRDGWAWAEHEAVAIATWLKRFAEALLPKQD